MAQKLKPGDGTISAGEFNRHVDAAEVVLGRQVLGMPGLPLRLDYDTNRATVKNASGADRRRGEILGLSGSPLAEFGQGELWLSGVAPAADKRFGVLLDPIPNGTIANRACQTGGVCAALVSVNHFSHNFARPIPGNYVLQSCRSGPVAIIAKPAGAGERTCIVQLDPFMPVRFAAPITCAAADPTPGSSPFTGTHTLPQANVTGLFIVDASGTVVQLDSGGNVQPYNPLPWSFADDFCWIVPTNGAWLIDRPMYWSMPSCTALLTTGDIGSGGFAVWPIAVSTIESNKGGAFDISGGALRFIGNGITNHTWVAIDGYVALRLNASGSSELYNHAVSLGFGGTTAGNPKDEKQWRYSSTSSIMSFHVHWTGTIAKNTTFQLFSVGAGVDNSPDVMHGRLSARLL